MALVSGWNIVGKGLIVPFPAQVKVDLTKFKQRVRLSKLVYNLYICVYIYLLIKQSSNSLYLGCVIFTGTLNCATLFL